MHIKAAAWIKSLPEGRDRDSLDAGCKGTLQAYWDHSDWNLAGNTSGLSSPNVSYATIARETGTKPATVEDRVRKLVALGWARRGKDGRLHLAWAVPFARCGPLAETVASSMDPDLSKATVTRDGSDPSQWGVRPELVGGPTRVSGGSDPSQTKQPHEPIQEQIIEPPTAAVGQPPRPSRTRPSQRRRQNQVAQVSLPNIYRPPEIVSWWAKYNEARRACHVRWHKDDGVREIKLTDERLGEFQNLLALTEPDKPLEKQLESADHVIEALVAWVDRDEGKMVPIQGRSDYDSMNRLTPAYWMQEKHFTKALESSRRTSTERVRTGYFGGSGHGSKAIHRRRAEELRREAAARGEVIPDHEPMSPGWMDEP